MFSSLVLPGLAFLGLAAAAYFGWRFYLSQQSDLEKAERDRHRQARELRRWAAKEGRRRTE